MHDLCCNESCERRKNLAAIKECEWHLLSNALMNLEGDMFLFLYTVADGIYCRLWFVLL